MQIRGTPWWDFPWLVFLNNATNGRARVCIAPVVAGASILVLLAAPLHRRIDGCRATAQETT